MGLKEVLAAKKAARVYEVKPAEPAESEIKTEPAAEPATGGTHSLFRKSAAVATAAEPATQPKSLFANKNINAEPPAAAAEKPKTNPFRFASPSVKQEMGLPVKAEELVGGPSGETINLEALENFNFEAGDDFDHPGQPTEYTEEEAERVRSLFQMLAENIDQREAVAEVVYTITSRLQSNPNFKEILRPEDFGLMVRGMRTAYGVLAAKKSETKSKRAPNSENVNDFLMGLKDIGFGKRT